MLNRYRRPLFYSLPILLSRLLGLLSIVDSIHPITLTLPVLAIYTSMTGGGGYITDSQWYACHGITPSGRRHLPESMSTDISILLATRTLPKLISIASPMTQRNQSRWNNDLHFDDGGRGLRLTHRRRGVCFHSNLTRTADLSPDGTL